MRKRFLLNVAALAIVAGGGVSLSAQKSTSPGTGGSCCQAVGYVCYVDAGDGIVVAFSNTRAC